MSHRRLGLHRPPAPPPKGSFGLSSLARLAHGLKCVSAWGQGDHVQLWGSASSFSSPIFIYPLQYFDLPPNALGITTVFSIARTRDGRNKERAFWKCVSSGGPERFRGEQYKLCVNTGRTGMLVLLITVSLGRLLTPPDISYVTDL